jgi:tetratricopeptide (TPR) repeat protein
MSDDEHDGEIRPLISSFLYGIFVVVSLIGSAVAMVIPSFGVEILFMILSLYVAIALLSFRLSELVHWLMNYLGFPLISGIYTGYHSGASYDNGYYRDDMDKARKLVREEKWDQAIQAYREIIRKAAEEIEPRFNLAEVYQKAGHLGLAMSEYHKIVNLKYQVRDSCLYVRESERCIEELKRHLIASKAEENDSCRN